MVGICVMPFLFMGLLEDYLFLPWLGLVVCQSSCPFQKYEFRLPSNGSWSALASLFWWVTPDPWINHCRLLLLSDSAGSACSSTTRLYRPTIRQAAVVCIQAVKEPFLCFISLCPLPIHFSFPKYPPLWLLLYLYHQPQCMSSMDPLALCQPAYSLWGEWLCGGFV